MSQYRFYLTSTISTVIEVEAGSYDEAEELAYQRTPSTNLVGNDFDSDGDWEIAEAYCDDKLLLGGEPV